MTWFMSEPIVSDNIYPTEEYAIWWIAFQLKIPHTQVRWRKYELCTLVDIFLVPHDRSINLRWRKLNAHTHWYFDIYSRNLLGSEGWAGYKTVGAHISIAFGPAPYALGAINLCQLHCVSKSVAQKVQSPILHERLHTAPPWPIA